MVFDMMKRLRYLFVIGVLVTISLLAVYYNANLYYGTDTMTSNTHLYGKDISNMKYVLIHKTYSTSPFLHFPDGQEIFLAKNCSVTNCYLTSDKDLLSDITAFHYVLFDGKYVVRQPPEVTLPANRSRNQGYVFASIESSDYYYVPDMRYNGVFNYTWTYKLNSDIYNGYITIRNKNGEVIGPRENISWINAKDMAPIDKSIKEKLIHKKLPVAWFVSNCHSQNHREKWALQIDEELNKYNMSLDIFGNCLYKRCPVPEQCAKMIQRDYFFYLAFENSMSDDYVTEKLLRALRNYAVPVVFGGADYKRFMPDGIYLNAREMSVKALVKQMVEAMRDKNKYYNFFKWHNHYSYHSPDESPDTDVYCEFCDFINKIKPNSYSVIDNFFEWWNPHVIPLVSLVM